MKKHSKEIGNSWTSLTWRFFRTGRRAVTPTGFGERIRLGKVLGLRRMLPFWRKSQECGQCLASLGTGSESDGENESGRSSGFGQRANPLPQLSHRNQSSSAVEVLLTLNAVVFFRDHQGFALDAEISKGKGFYSHLVGRFCRRLKSLSLAFE